MAKTYQQIAHKIALLKVEAEKRRVQEKKGVVARIKDAIAAFDLTPQDLFGGRGEKLGRPGRARKAIAARKSSKSKIGRTAKFADGNGNEWVGRGPRPMWLRTALAEGKKLEDFAVGGAVAPAAVVARDEAAATATKKKMKRRRAAQGTAAVRASMGTRASAKKGARAAAYRDAAGHEWGGRGPRPQWLRDALAAGETLEKFRV
jgi:DNA-binding protein H-NS